MTWTAPVFARAQPVIRFHPHRHSRASPQVAVTQSTPFRTRTHAASVHLRQIVARQICHRAVTHGPWKITKMTANFARTPDAIGGIAPRTAGSTSDRGALNGQRPGGNGGNGGQPLGTGMPRRSAESPMARNTVNCPSQPERHGLSQRVQPRPAQFRRRRRRSVQNWFLCERELSERQASSCASS